MTTKQIIVFGIISGVIITLGDMYYKPIIVLVLYFWGLCSSGAFIAQWRRNKTLSNQIIATEKEIKPLQNHIIALEKELAKYEKIAIAGAVHDIQTYTELLKKNQKQSQKNKKQNQN